MTGEKGASDHQWPPKPYKGFNYFRPDDRPLLAGRDDDVAACTLLLAHPETRLLLLHGVTGCGKSSFLRAGLIPDMEDDKAYLFLKVAGTDDEALFIRSTEAPVDQIARQVFLFASAPFQINTPTGLRVLDLTPALLGLDSWEAFLAATREQDGLLESLRRIASIIPRILVLIVDQAEEVLTHNPGEENFVNRVLFFNFLRDFQSFEFPARIIATLRTEYFGRFIDATQVNYRASNSLKQFFLAELSRTALIEAIMRPTVQGNFRPYGPPHYGFEFQDDLPKRIVQDILGAPYSGPALPVLQLVCLGLYEDAIRKGRKLIERDQYIAMGMVEGQIIDHIDRAIQAIYATEHAYTNDLEKIRQFLAEFYAIQDDGTVVARAREASWVDNELAKRELSIQPEALIKGLTHPNNLILRSIPAVKAGGRIVNEVTLGHDSVGLALERWKARDAETRMRALQEEQRLLARHVETQLRILEEQQRSEVDTLSAELKRSNKQYGKLAKEIASNFGVSLVNTVMYIILFLTAASSHVFVSQF